MFSQVLATELEQLKLQKQSLEVQLTEVQHLRESDLHQYQQQLSALEQELARVLEERNEIKELGEHNQSLSIELEKEKGRLAGKIRFLVLKLCLSHKKQIVVQRSVQLCALDNRSIQIKFLSFVHEK